MVSISYNRLEFVLEMIIVMNASTCLAQRICQIEARGLCVGCLLVENFELRDTKLSVPCYFATM